MLYPTLNQPLVFLVVVLTGLLSGFIFDFSKILSTLSGGDKWSRNIFDFIATILSFTILFFTNLYFNFGQFRLFVFIFFLLSLCCQRFFSKFLWTKLLSKWYTSIAKKKEKKGEKNKVD